MKTEKQIVAWMRSQGMSGVVIKRMERLMEQFSTPAAFFEASQGAISGAYAKVSSGNSHGLGKSFWMSFDKVLKFFKSKDDAPEAEASPVREPEAPAVDERLVRLIPYKDLKAVVDMMEMLEIEAINLMEITGFLASVRFRQNKIDVHDNGNKEGGQNA